MIRRRRGILPILIALLLIVIIVFAVMIINSQEQGLKAFAPEAATLANDIKQMPLINGTACNDVLIGIFKVNVVVANLNQVLGTTF